LILGLMVCVVVIGGRVAHAQPAESPGLRPHHVTLSAGLVWTDGYDVGASTAHLRGNGAGPSAAPFTLFSADSRLTRATAPDFRVGYAVTSRVALEGGMSFAQPRIAFAIARDAEAPAQELVGEKLDQYQIDANLTWQLPVGLGPRLAPFATIGAGYLRQLHEDRVLAETGQIYFGGAGARYWLKGGHGAARALGLRGDVRVAVRKGGIDFENRKRAYPSVSLMLFVGL
jgi:hypothetical protein